MFVQRYTADLYIFKISEKLKKKMKGNKTVASDFLSAMIPAFCIFKILKVKF